MNLEENYKNLSSYNQTDSWVLLVTLFDNSFILFRFLLLNAWNSCQFWQITITKCYRRILNNFVVFLTNGIAIRLDSLSIKIDRLPCCIRNQYVIMLGFQKYCKNSSIFDINLSYISRLIFEFRSICFKEWISILLVYHIWVIKSFPFHNIAQKNKLFFVYLQIV